MPARADYRKVLRWSALAVLALVLLAAGTAWAMIEWGVASAQRSAVAQFSGRDSSQALIDLVNCENCAMEQRNRAVWTLGQIREQRALAALHQHFYDGPCDHSKFICQHELRKALKRIESQPPVHARR
jgi:hypothetical protein